MQWCRMRLFAVNFFKILKNVLGQLLLSFFYARLLIVHKPIHKQSGTLLTQLKLIGQLVFILVFLIPESIHESFRMI